MPSLSLLLVREAVSTVPTANLLDSTVKAGLIPVSLLAICSVLSTFALLSWLTYSLVVKHDYQAYVGYNQYVILIFNLLLADLQQSLSFLISAHWLHLGYIDSPSNTCFAQGWLIQIGDVSSGLFVFAIAFHTWYSVVLSRKLEYRTFTWAILGLWAFALLLTVLGPGVYGPHYFVRAGVWCWADTRYDLARLWLHYVWIFIVEFGTVVIYAHVFIHLRRQLKSIRSVNSRGHDSTSKLSHAARYMVLYPIIYVVLTIPLAAGRMAAMSGSPPPDIYYCIAGSFMTSCGWLDSLLYTFTRRVFIKPETRDAPSTGHQSTRAPTNSKRRWVGMTGSKAKEAVAQPSASQWHLSTFASVDMKAANDGSDSNSDDLIFEAGYSRGRNTPTLEDRVKKQKGISHTETLIEKGDEDTLVVQNAIVTETTIEVVSTVRDERDGPM